MPVPNDVDIFHASTVSHASISSEAGPTNGMTLRERKRPVAPSEDGLDEYLALASDTEKEPSSTSITKFATPTVKLKLTRSANTNAEHQKKKKIAGKRVTENQPHEIMQPIALDEHATGSDLVTKPPDAPQNGSDFNTNLKYLVDVNDWILQNANSEVYERITTNGGSNVVHLLAKDMLEAYDRAYSWINLIKDNTKRYATLAPSCDE